LQSLPFAFFSLHTVCAFVIRLGNGAVAAVDAAGSLELASDAVAVMTAVWLSPGSLLLIALRILQIRANPRQLTRAMLGT